MKRSKIVVIGSTNMDMVVKSQHIPEPGETVLGGDFLMNPGGKGANQAISIARLGADVSFVTKVGKDMFGRQSSQSFEEEGIGTDGILFDETASSGVALITVDELGENSIVVAPGASLTLSPKDVEAFLNSRSDVSIILIQLEIPMETVKFAVEYASSRGIKVIVNPAPANALVPELFQMIDIITPNTNEAEMLTGIKIEDIDSAKEAAEALHHKGVKNVAVTLGANGVVLCQEGEVTYIPAVKVEAVDTTAAGDVFNGALTFAISEGWDFVRAARFASKTAAITATRMGAQSSIPYRRELDIDKEYSNY